MTAWAANRCRANQTPAIRSAIAVGERSSPYHRHGRGLHRRFKRSLRARRQICHHSHEIGASQLTERETNPKERSKTAPKAQVKSGVSKKTKEEALAHQMELRKDVQRENRPSAEPIYLSGGHLTIAIGRAIEIFPASPSIMLVQCDQCRTSPGSTPCNSFGKIYAASNLLPSRVAHLLSSARKGHKITWIG